MKKGPGLLDTGPLVSFLAAGLSHHSWTCEQWKFFQPPLLTCKPVLTEAAFLLSREGHEADPLFALLKRESSALRSICRKSRQISVPSCTAIAISLCH